MSLVVWISGHGFGHLAQISPVVELLHRHFPRWRVWIYTSIPADIVHQRLSIPHRLLSGQVDVGVVQHHAISEDWLETSRQAASFYAPEAFARRVQADVIRLAPLRPRLMLSDISPLAFPVARQLKIPSLALANLDWHDIYQPQLKDQHPEVLTTLARAHGEADMLLRMPWHMPMRTFPVIRDIPLLPQPCQASKAQLRHRLGLADERRQLALVLFGGTTMPAIALQQLAAIRDYLFLFPGWPEGKPVPNNVRLVRYAQPFTTREWMRAADVLVCKPGYGVLSEAWNEGIPLAYAPRPGFPEYPYMHRWLQQHAPAVLISEADLVAGSWSTALQQAADCPRRWPVVDDSAEQQITDAILSLL